jgi:hypothetical protein
MDGKLAGPDLGAKKTSLPVCLCFAYRDAPLIGHLDLCGENGGALRVSGLPGEAAGMVRWQEAPSCQKRDPDEQAQRPDDGQPWEGCERIPMVLSGMAARPPGQPRWDQLP